MKPMDVLEAGRMATIQDPTGAHVSLWQPKEHIGAKVVNKVGAMGWNELYTPDSKKAQQFYGELFNWKFETDDTGYTIIKNANYNDRMNGGIVEITKEMGDMPPHWLTYFTVEDIAASADKVKELGGSLPMPIKKVNVGKLATVADPAGVHFMIIELGVGAEEWENPS